MTDQPIEKQVEEILKCNTGKLYNGCAPNYHVPGCPASHRTAVLALLERRENEHVENIKAAEEVTEKETENKVLIFLENFGEAKAMEYAEMLRAAIFDSGGEPGALARHDQRLLERREQEHAAQVKAARLGESEWWHKKFHWAIGIPCDGTMEECERVGKNWEAAPPEGCAAVKQLELERREQEHAAEVKKTRLEEAQWWHGQAMSHTECTEVQKDINPECERLAACRAAVQQAELGPCPRHGKEFWVEPPQAKSLSESRRFKLQGGHCTACAQEKGEIR
jgi:hypothetical protein